ncbi:MAG: hypothetical protein V3T80_07865, partial [Kiloniellales bacterium]
NPVYIKKVEQIQAVDGIADGDSNQPRSALARASEGLGFPIAAPAVRIDPGPEAFRLCLTRFLAHLQRHRWGGMALTSPNLDLLIGCVRVDAVEVFLER